jgi:hypothetical protein
LFVPGAAGFNGRSRSRLIGFTPETKKGRSRDRPFSLPILHKEKGAAVSRAASFSDAFSA